MIIPLPSQLPWAWLCSLLGIGFVLFVAAVVAAKLIARTHVQYSWFIVTGAVALGFLLRVVADWVAEAVTAFFPIILNGPGDPLVAYQVTVPLSVAVGLALAGVIGRQQAVELPSIATIAAGISGVLNLPAGRFPIFGSESVPDWLLLIDGTGRTWLWLGLLVGFLFGLRLFRRRVEFAGLGVEEAGDDPSGTSLRVGEKREDEIAAGPSA